MRVVRDRSGHMDVRDDHQYLASVKAATADMVQKTDEAQRQREAILQDAKQQADKIVQDAQAQADRLLTESAALL